MKIKSNNERLSIALKKNLKKRKLFQKKNKKKKDDTKEKILDASKPITLDFLTNPNKE